MNKNAVFQLIVAMSIFGSVGFFSNLTGLPAIELVWIRCIFAAVFLCIAWIVTGSFKRERWDSDIYYNRNYPISFGSYHDSCRRNPSL